MQQRVRMAVGMVVALTVGSLAALSGAPGGATTVAAAAPTVGFAGRTWTMKTSSGAVGPGPNVFAAANVTVDLNGKLHLKIAKRSNRWTSAEVVLNASLGYGTYAWTLGSNVSNLDAQAVLGLFTWNDDPAYNHREIDFEASRWGWKNDVTNAQWVVQPYDTAGNLTRFTIGSTVPTVVRFTWSPTSIVFQTVVGGTVVNERTYTGADIPLPGGENARMNLWLYQGKAPLNKATVEVVLNTFSFTPPA